MIELIFVIVILGGLTAIAIPKRSATRDNAIVVKVVQAVSLALNEIAACVVAQGKVENDLSLISNAVKSSINLNGISSGISNNAVDFKMGT